MPLGLGFFATAGGAAGGGTPAYDLIATTLATGSSDIITFSNINTYTDYKHLQFRMTLKSTFSSVQNLNITLNGDTGNNYAYHQLVGNGSTVTSSSSSATSPIALQSIVSDTSSTGVWGGAIIDILDFSSTSKTKTLRILSGLTGSRIQLSSALWNSTSALTSVTFAVGNGSFSSGSRLSIYGVKG